MRSMGVGRAVAVLAICVAARAARGDGKVSEGRTKGLACAACHVANEPVSDAPRIAGQRERYLVNQLREAFGFAGSPIRIQVRSRRRKPDEHK